MVKILFVCMGNICRSPTAEGVFSHLVEQENLSAAVEIDSAGTIGFHIGNPPDPRATEAALLRGIDLSTQRSRIVEQEDFEYYDYIIAMDFDNESELTARCPDAHKEKIQLFLNYAHNSPEQEVPDPYYGSGNGFEHVLDLVEDASVGFLKHLTKKGDC